MITTSTHKSGPAARRLGFFTTFLVAGLFAAACGASSNSPGKLSKRVDDTHIASVGIEQKSSILAAKQSWDMAVMARDKVVADLSQAQALADISKNDVDQADLAIKSAKIQKKEADATADTTKINDGERAVQRADLTKKAAVAHRDYLNAYRDSLKTAQRAAEDTVLWREAQYELAKAQVASSNNIAPAGFNLADFEKQERDRAKAAQSGEKKVSDARSKALSKRDSWIRQQTDTDTSLAERSNKADPMAAPAPVQ